MTGQIVDQYACIQYCRYNVYALIVLSIYGSLLLNFRLETVYVSTPSVYRQLAYGPGRGGPVSRIDFTKTSVSPVSPLKNRLSIGDTDSQGPKSIDFKAIKVSIFPG